MSLIEQALRRIKDPSLTASEASASKVSAPPKTEAPDAPKAHSWPADPASSPAPGMPSTPFLVASGIVLVLVASGILLGAFWLGQIFSRSRSTPSVASTSTTVPLAAPETGEVAAPAEPAREPARARSPLAFLGGREGAKEEPAAPKEFVLSGVVEGWGEPYAVINDAIVGIGQQVAGATLLEIADGAVRLRRPDGTELTLHVTN